MSQRYYDSMKRSKPLDVKNLSLLLENSAEGRGSRTVLLALLSVCL